MGWGYRIGWSKGDRAYSVIGHRRGLRVHFTDERGKATTFLVKEQSNPLASHMQNKLRAMGGIEIVTENEGSQPADSADAAQVAAEKAGTAAQDYGLRTVEVRVCGPGPHQPVQGRTLDVCGGVRGDLGAIEF